MVVIYSQDKTYIRNDADTAKSILASVYGEKLGEEAYVVVKEARVGTSYRKNGGPLVKVVTNTQAEVIRERETTIGMI